MWLTLWEDIEPENDGTVLKVEGAVEPIFGEFHLASATERWGREPDQGPGSGYPPCFSRNASAESARKSSSAARNLAWSQSHQASAR